MKRDPLTDDAIGWLVLWHRYEKAYNQTKGYPKECPSTRGWLASKQYDDQNGAMETDQRGRRLKDVGPLINGFGDPWTSALQEIAKRHADGCAVFFHPRLPVDKNERAEIKARALAMFVDSWYS